MSGISIADIPNREEVSREEEMEDSNTVSSKENIVDIPLRRRENKKERKQEALPKKKVTEKSSGKEKKKAKAGEGDKKFKI